MNLLLIGCILISPKDVIIERDTIRLTEEDFWEEDIITVIDTDKKRYTRFKLSLIEKRNLWGRIFWYTKKSLGKIVHIPMSSFWEDLNDLNTGYNKSFEIL